jgi:TrmH family RNA methyltransferase
VEPVRSHRAKSVVEAARLHRARERRARGLTLVEGPDLLRDITAAGAGVIEVFGIDPPPDSGVVAVDRRALERLAGTSSPRGPVAVVEIPTEWLDRDRNLLVSVGVSDPGNMGTMIRTAAAYAWGFAYTEGSADPWAPKAIRAGAGGQFQTSVAKVILDDLGHWETVAAVVRGGSSPESISARPVALLIGEESGGLPRWMSETAHHRLTIPTPGVTESLNAAVASAIAIHELSKGSGRADGAV